MSEQEQQEFEIHMNRLFWKLMKCLGLPILGIVAGGVVFWASMNAHVADGHPETVRQLIHEQDIRTARVETKVDSLIESMGRLEKKIDRNTALDVSFQ